MSKIPRDDPAGASIQVSAMFWPTCRGRSEKRVGKGGDGTAEEARRGRKTFTSHSSTPSSPRLSSSTRGSTVFSPISLATTAPPSLAMRSSRWTTGR
eukprot:scaffold7363_cov263-Pinguiococcus_pyrenoidosus.AAC.20